MDPALKIIIHSSTTSFINNKAKTKAYITPTIVRY